LLKRELVPLDVGIGRLVDHYRKHG
jgi:hypothetical protein